MSNIQACDYGSRAPDRRTLLDDCGLERYVRFSTGDEVFCVEASEAADVAAQYDAAGIAYIMADVWMTIEDWEQLPPL
jgi:hypothetical protein